MLRLKYVFFFITVTALAAFSLGFYAGYFGARNIFLGQELESWAQEMGVKAAAFVHPAISADLQGKGAIRDLSRPPKASGTSGTSGEARRNRP
jgi:hypothetical protein